MRIRDRVEIIRTKVREHGNYRVLAKNALVGYEWLTKFSVGVIKNPTVDNVARLEEYFDTLDNNKF